MNNLFPSQNCLDLVKSFEGFRAFPYTDSGGVWTIGYGTTYLPNGTRVTKATPKITELQSCQYLMDALTKLAPQINKLIISCLNQNQLDALCSFVYNIGIGNFKNSTLLKEININPNNPDIANQFAKWKYDNGKILNGLIARRKLESNLYFS